MRRLFRYLFGPRQARVWLVEDSQGYWHKVVTYERPYTSLSSALLGPFRSEVDAEEAADRMNSEDVPYYGDGPEDALC